MGLGRMGRCRERGVPVLPHLTEAQPGLPPPPAVLGQEAPAGVPLAVDVYPYISLPGIGLTPWQLDL